jgi:hypothetical protein
MQSSQWLRGRFAGSPGHPKTNDLPINENALEET